MNTIITDFHAFKDKKAQIRKERLRLEEELYRSFKTALHMVKIPELDIDDTELVELEKKLITTLEENQFSGFSLIRYMCYFIEKKEKLLGDNQKQAKVDITSALLLSLAGLQGGKKELYQEQMHTLDNILVKNKIPEDIFQVMHEVKEKLHHLETFILSNK